MQKLSEELEILITQCEIKEKPLYLLIWRL